MLWGCSGAVLGLWCGSGAALGLSAIGALSAMRPLRPTSVHIHRGGGRSAISAPSAMSAMSAISALSALSAIGALSAMRPLRPLRPTSVHIHRGGGSDNHRGERETNTGEGRGAKTITHGGEGGRQGRAHISGVEKSGNAPEGELCLYLGIKERT